MSFVNYCPLCGSSMGIEKAECTQPEIFFANCNKCRVKIFGETEAEVKMKVENGEFRKLNEKFIKYRHRVSRIIQAIFETDKEA